MLFFNTTTLGETQDKKKQLAESDEEDGNYIYYHEFYERCSRIL